jgi:polyhydroxybutyrate depolymerase
MNVLSVLSIFPLAACSSSSNGELAVDEGVDGGDDAGKDTSKDAGKDASNHASGDASTDVSKEGGGSDAQGGGEAGSATCPVGAKSGSASGGTVTINVDGNTVNVLVRVPPGYVPTQAYPFVMVYAPAGATAAINESFTGLTPEAQKRGYIIAYADNSLFNAQRAETEVQESAGAIPAVTAQWCVDPKRIYVTGHSNGGTITEVIGAQQLATLAAIAPSAAGISASVFQMVGCPSAPLPEMEMHSSGDQLFPISQGFGAQVAQAWAKCDGCGSSPSPPDSDGCIDYSGCSSGVEVRYCQGTAAHGVWPGLNKAIFNFFDQFTAP